MIRSLSLLLSGSLSLLLAPLVMAAPVTAAELWRQYVASPDSQPNIPDCSYAGYRASETPLPVVKVVANVMENGAKADGKTDDTAAFAAAIEKAHAAGGGAVLVPTGTYHLEGLIHLKYSNIVLRGEGDKTILDFANDLTKVVAPMPVEGKSGWSWSGGLVWIGPADTFSGGKIATVPAIGEQAWEYWRPGANLATVQGAYKSGERKLKIGGKAPAAGAMVMMTWDNPADFSLLKTIAGHPTMDAFNWASATWIGSKQYPQFQWVVQVESASGGEITLKQPTRLDIRPEWKVSFRELGASVSESGVEHLKIKGHAPATHLHLSNKGFNGVYVNRAYNCWVNDVEIESCENGVNLASAKNVTVRGAKMTGPEQQHHSFACRVNSHDNLFEDFAIAGPNRVKHGINTEWLSSGNVWHKGKMARGTFDSHRALSFDSIRTDITVANDNACNPGGGGPAGPYLGKRVVHWNIRVEGSDRKDKGEFVNQPEALPMGALVGIQGAPQTAAPAPAMPKGDKGCVIADPGKAPEIPDLFEAQLKLRLKK